MTGSVFRFPFINSSMQMGLTYDEAATTILYARKLFNLAKWGIDIAE